MAPTVPDPYHTLALVHEAMGNTKKAFSFSMLGAHLTPKDVALWKRLAAQSHEQGSYVQAVYCLTKVRPRPKVRGAPTPPAGAIVMATCAAVA